MKLRERKRQGGAYIEMARDERLRSHPAALRQRHFGVRVEEGGVTNSNKQQYLWAIINIDHQS